MAKYSNGNDLIKGMVILGDFIILNFIIAIFLTQFQDWVPPFFQRFRGPRLVFLTANLAMVISQYFFQTILHYRRVAFEDIFYRVFKLSFAQAFLMFLFLRVINNMGGLFKFMFVFGAVEVILLFLSRIVERYFIGHYRQLGRNTRRVVFIGDDPAVLELYKEMKADSSTGYIILGYYADHEIAECPDSFTKLGDINDVKRIVERETSEGDTQLDSAEEVFCCLSHSLSDIIVGVMRFCDKHIIHFFYVPRKFGNYTLNLKPTQYGDMAIFTNHNEPLTNLSNRFIKRSFDVFFSSIMCLMLLIILPFVALIIKIQSPGPIFFKQARTGLNGKTFMCYKFRSMHINDEADLAQATLDDPRKYPFGNIMRKTNLDEFPQFFNVLRGDMSIVGPRPHMLLHTETYSKLIGKYMVRHFCKPGITGWAQVSGFRGETKELWMMEERINRDIWYIENWSFLLDLKIIAMTAWTVVHPDKKAY